MGLMDFRPLVQVSLDGVPLSGVLFSRLVSVSVSDAAGFESDAVRLDFDNGGLFQRIAMPRPGAEITVALGYAPAFRDMGVYVADEIEEGGPPVVISITGRAKAHGRSNSGLSAISQQKTRTWPAGTTLSALAQRIADENGLAPAVAEAAGSIVLDHLDQLDESDISLLTRLAVKYDLAAKPAGGRLYIGSRAAGISASGQALPRVALRPARVTSWRMRRALGETAGTVVATWRDREGARDVEVSEGSGEPVRRLKERFASQEAAAAVAKGELRRATRLSETISISMPGEASVMAEGLIDLTGFSDAADGEWSIVRCEHSVSSSGYMTSLEAQRVA